MAEMSRRRFLTIGAQGMALATIPAVFQFNPMAAFATPMDKGGSLADFYEHFGVDSAIIRRVMEAALEKGGDYCDLYFQHRLSNTIVLEDKLVSRAYSNVDFGVGLRVLKGDQTGYSFTEDISELSMILAAKTAAGIANDTREIPPQHFAAVDLPNYYPIETKWEDIRIDRKIPYLERINDRMIAKDNRVVKSSVYFSDDTSFILLVTSDGKAACDYQPMTSITATCTAEQDGKREENYHNLGGRHGIEYFTDANVNELADESVRRTVELFDAVKPEAGEMEVVMAAGSSGILLHEAIGHGMEADFNRKEVSIFSDKINKSVAQPFVSIVDDGTNPNARGSINVDDEGNLAEKTYLVENGVLRSYLHDRISAKYYGVNPTGSGRRESFRHSPMPRMRNTYMLPGPHTKDEIIASTKKGILAETFTNGQVFIGAGDFTFYVKSGYLIEDGKLSRPVKDINLIGNGPRVLEDIVMVADDLTMSQGGWTCGKNGQSVPVSMGLPTVKVSKVTVGGVNS